MNEKGVWLTATGCVYFLSITKLSWNIHFLPLPYLTSLTWLLIKERLNECYSVSLLVVNVCLKSSASLKCRGTGQVILCAFSHRTDLSHQCTICIPISLSLAIHSCQDDNWNTFFFPRNFHYEVHFFSWFIAQFSLQIYLSNLDKKKLVKMKRWFFSLALGIVCTHKQSTSFSREKCENLIIQHWLKYSFALEYLKDFEFLWTS